MTFRTGQGRSSPAAPVPAVRESLGISRAGWHHLHSHSRCTCSQGRSWDGWCCRCGPLQHESLYPPCSPTFSPDGHHHLQRAQRKNKRLHRVLLLFVPSWQAGEYFGIHLMQEGWDTLSWAIWQSPLLLSWSSQRPVEDSGPAPAAPVSYGLQLVPELRDFKRLLTSAGLLG